MPAAHATAEERTRRWWNQPDRYGTLLALLVLNYLTGLLLQNEKGVQLVALVLTVGSLLLALRTSEVRGRVMVVAVAACGVAVAISAVEAARNEAASSAIVSLVLGLLLLAAPVSILRRILSAHRIVTSETLAAALSVYLLLGLAFANLYVAMEVWDPGTFTGVAPGDLQSDLVYFSFVTLTTVGFGDITAVSDTARSLVVSEALLGQIVLVTFVARVVGLMGAPHDREERQRLREELEAEDRAEAAAAQALDAEATDPDDEPDTTA